MKYASNIEFICPICGSEKTSKINIHLYSILRCLKCQHESIISKEKNIEKFVSKILKNNKIKQTFTGSLENIIEYSYCPYWTLMKLFNKVDSIVIRKRNQETIQCHRFSDKSVKIYAEKILIPHTIIEEKDVFIIKFQQ